MNKVRRIGKVDVNYTSELLFPREIAKYIEEHGERLMDEDVLAMLRAIDREFTRRFGTDPYSRLIKMKREKDGS